MAYQRMLLISSDPSAKSYINHQIQLEQDKLRKEASTLSPCELTSKIYYLTRLYHNPEVEKDGWKPLIHDTLKMYRSYRRKQRIPSTVKRVVWNTYIGEDKGKSPCVCCKTTIITQLSFHCGHVISEYDGGTIEISNLRPICQNCNSSMGKRPMGEFIKQLRGFV